MNAPTVYRGDRLPAELRGNVFVAEPSGNLVSRIIVSDDGTSLRGRKAYDNAEFLASTDERFRPVYLSSAPDGTIYVVDMYHGIIQHKGYITEYLRDHIVAHKLEAPIHMGRIWRIVHDTTRRDGPPALEPRRRPAGRAALASRTAGGATRRSSCWCSAATSPSCRRAEEARRAAPRTRGRGCMRCGRSMGSIASSRRPSSRRSTISSRDVRASAVRLAERFLAASQSPVHDAVLKRVDDADWAVRQQLAASLGALPAGPA